MSAKEQRRHGDAAAMLGHFNHKRRTCVHGGSRDLGRFASSQLSRCSTTRTCSAQLQSILARDVASLSLVSVCSNGHTEDQ